MVPTPRQVTEPAEDLPRTGAWARLPPVELALLLLLVATLAAAASMLVRRRGGARQRAVGRLLDAADALETRLRSAQAEIEAVTGDEDATREAMQEMLRQRLWLQQHGQDAPLAQIDDVRRSLEEARVRIEDQLQRIERAREPTF